MTRLCFVIALVLCTVACGKQSIAGTQPTAEAAARAVLRAIEQRDHAQLHSLALTEEEFKGRVWPHLPAARPERNLPWSYVWMELRQKSDAMLARTLAEHGGRRYALESVQFTGATTNHASYKVHRDTVVTVRDASGSRHELRILGSMIEADEGWKVFSYVAN